MSEEPRASAAREAAQEGPYERARASWGFPAFARDFPRDEDLDRLVIAFTEGNYAAIHDGAPRLAEQGKDEDVRHAALVLLERTRPDPAAKILVGLAAALLVVLSAWWILHPTH